jgi:hypothetical protein
VISIDAAIPALLGILIPPNAAEGAKQEKIDVFTSLGTSFSAGYTLLLLSFYYQLE